MENLNIRQCLDCLSEVLEKRGARHIIYICGGAEIALLGNEERATADIDAISPEIDKELLECVDIVKKDLQLREFWINGQVSPLNKRLPKNWKKKTVSLYKTDSLEVRGISREDLIATKLSALVNRDSLRDLDDIKWLNPTKAECTYALKYVKTNHKDPIALEKAKAYLEYLYE